MELVIAPLWSVPMDIAPNYAGTASSFMNVGFGLAGITSPLVFGWIIDRTGQLAASVCCFDGPSCPGHRPIFLHASGSAFQR